MCLGSPISCWHHLLYLAPWMNGNMNKVDILWLVGCLCNKQDNTWLLGDMESLCLYPTQYLTWELFRCTVKERFYIFTHPCIILFINNNERPSSTHSEYQIEVNTGNDSQGYLSRKWIRQFSLSLWWPYQSTVTFNGKLFQRKTMSCENSQIAIHM